MDEQSPEYIVLRMLRERNWADAGACYATRSCETLLVDCKTLEAQVMQQQHNHDLLSKEHHEMAADLQLLRENEANAGVTREHIELLQHSLELSKSEAAQNAKEAAAAKASEASTSEAATLMAEKLADAQAKAADLEHRLKQITASEVAVRTENERLIDRLTEHLSVQAKAMDSEIEQHEQKNSRRPEPDAAT